MNDQQASEKANSFALQLDELATLTLFLEWLTAVISNLPSYFNE